MCIFEFDGPKPRFALIPIPAAAMWNKDGYVLLVSFALIPIPAAAMSASRS